jgi:hypothetical protein
VDSPELKETGRPPHHSFLWGLLYKLNNKKKPYRIKGKLFHIVASVFLSSMTSANSLVVQPTLQVKKGLCLCFP